MIKRIAAIAFIFICATIAWGILGATIFQRTYSSDSSSTVQVASTWGAPQNQLPPTAYYEEFVLKKEVTTENGKKKEVEMLNKVTNLLPLESSHLNVDLNLEHRQKGLLWYSTYKVGFDGSYSFRNTSDKDQTICFTLNFPTAQAIYDDLMFTVDDVPVALKNGANSAGGTARVAAGKTATLKVGYKSQGLNDWHYSFGNSGAASPADESQYRAGLLSISQVRDFSLQMKTNFKDIDFPENTLSPTEKTETANGWALNWNYKNLVSGYQIAMTMPEKLQPGPLAGRISFFAPVSLFFFFFLMLIITTMRGIELHPMNYFSLAYILGLGSPTFPLPVESYQIHRDSCHWKKIYDYEYLYAGPLFTHQFSHIWIDFRGIQDEFMREHGSDYFENTRRATYAQREYARQNPNGFKGYSELGWGLTACEGPGPKELTIDGVKRVFFDYVARGVPEGPDDGTLAPWAVVASLPFAPEIVVPALEHFNEIEVGADHPYGLEATFNPTFPDEDGRGCGWLSPWHFGINQGPIVLMIENHRTEFLWRLMTQSRYIVDGLHRAGFRGGWLK